MKTSHAFAAVLALSLLAPLSRGDADERIRWEPDAAAAFALAASEGKPLLVAFNMDDEVANDEAVRLHYRDPEIVRLSRKLVCLIGSIGDHTDDPGETCPRLGSLTCAQHREVEKEIRRRFIEGNLVEAPQHVLCAPSGEEMFRKAFQMSVPDLKRAMAAALIRAKDGPEARQACLSALRNASESVRALGLVAAYGLEPHPDLAKALRSLARHRSSSVRALAVWALAGQQDPEDEPDFDRFVRSARSPELRELATAAARIHRGEDVPGYANLFGAFFWDRGGDVHLRGSVFY